VPVPKLSDQMSANLHESFLLSPFNLYDQMAKYLTLKRNRYKLCSKHHN